jgi:anaphase-promoting complex subunit 11
VCGICRQAFDDTCPDCAVPGDDCPPVWGACNHMFHMHCIVKWLDSGNDAQHVVQQEDRRQCPMCRAEWQFRAD